MNKEVSKRIAVNELWRLGILHWKLHETQKEMYDAFKKSEEKKFIFNCARRTGKSFLLCVLAIEFAFQNPGTRICYAAPTAKAVKNIILPLMKIILKDCPDEIKPIWRGQDHYEFHNDSVLHIAGTDAERVEALRGQSMDLGICDEAGFMSDLDYVVSDVLSPQTLTTGGRIIIASTPPKTPDHDFKEYAEEAKIREAYIRKSIYDNPMIDKRTIISVMMECEPKLTWAEAETYYLEKSGPQNTTWRREYMAIFVNDDTLAIIPEFNDDSRPEIVIEAKRPEFLDCYVTMDIGYNDFTFAIFGYWDFLRAKLVIEDEVVLSEPTSTKIANEIKEKEFNLWNHKPPYMRLSDTDLIVIADLQRDHNLTFVPTKKDNKEAQVNMVRNWMNARKIEIHPRCRNLIAHLEAGVWNKTKRSFARSKKFGHYDGIDALIYMVRNVQTHKNPIPPGHGYNIHNQFIPPQKTMSNNSKVLKKAFSLKKFFPHMKED